jgi:drug/metabolite transporter (DMT)-like permease
MNAVLSAEQRSAQSHNLTIFLAFLSVYILWGSTYLAIRVAVATVPPFFAAGSRFVMAGVLLLAYTSIRRIPWPTAREWRNIAVSAGILFVPSYGGLFWAEKTVPSGIASAVVATIPVWMALGEMFVLKHTKLRWQLIASTVLGIGGVSILTVRGTSGGGSHSLLPYLVMLGSQITWSIGTLLTKNMQLPPSKPLVAGAQMGLGGLMLLVLAGATGELYPLPHVSMQAGLAILYLTIAGSVIAFTAYLYLLAYLPATTVASYAYVNPVVALALGYWLGHETLDWRVFLGTGLVLAGVVLILRGKRAH